MKAAILYSNFFDHDGKEQMIGGVETYLLNLARLCREMDMQTTIYQWSNLPFEKNVEGLKVKGVPICQLPFRKRNAALFKYVRTKIDENKDIVIFGADHKSVFTDNPRHISIQHGVSWDLPARHLTQRDIVRYKWAARIIKWRVIRSCKRHFANCHNTVCVDHNFLNWYRTTVTREPEGHCIWVIPNFTRIASEDQVKSRVYEQGSIRILFACRFVQLRGTRIFAGAAKHLLRTYDGVSFTFAGEGPDEDWLRSEFATEERVQFTKYMPDEALNMHLKHDIAVVPSLASEGTSLSVAEAMATGCPVVATAIGGVTNMLIDGYNGVLVMPNAQSLREGIESLIQDAHLRSRIGTRAYETARESFSLERWKNSWKRVLVQVSSME